MANQGEEEPHLAMTRAGESNASLLLGEDIMSSLEGSPESELQDSSAEEEEKEEEKVNEMKNSKPPRRPVLSMRPSPVIKRNNTEGSAVSALTDNAGEDPSVLHKKSISWEQGDYNDMGLPMFDESFDTPKSARSGVAPQRQRARGNWDKVKQTLGTNDLSTKKVNPLETEAEAAILRVVEKARRVNAATAGNILPHVTDEDANALRKQDPVASNHKKKPSTDDKSVLSGDTATSKVKGHNRTQTLDHKLFDLANEMDAIKNQNSSDGGGRARTQTGESGGRPRFFEENYVSLDEQKGNSGDVLAANAALLFRRPLKKDHSRMDPEAISETPLPNPSLAESLSSIRSNEKIWSAFSSMAAEDDAKKTDAVVETPETMNTGVDIEAGVVAGGDLPREKSKFHLGKKARRLAQRSNLEVREDFDSFWQFLRPRSRSMRFYLLIVVGCLIFPLVLTAAILFYSPAADNPDLGREGASTSWFLLFLARNVITGTLAKSSEVIAIDLLTLHLRLTPRLFGTIFALFLVQSKGWPFIVFSWGVFNFAMNSGYNPLAQHWLFWQDAIALFNASNPSGTITYSRVNYVVNGIAVGLGFVVALKRLWWGLYLGKRSYRQYGDELARVIKDMLMVSKVAEWSRDIDKYGRNQVFKKKGYKSTVAGDALNSVRIAEYMSADHNDDAPVVDPEKPTDGAVDRVLDKEGIFELTGSLNQSERNMINELLGNWEEPEILGEEQEKVSIASILQFRQMLAYMDEDYPFSLAYGPADSRESCVESAQSVYSRLLELTPNESLLPFDTLAVLAKNKENGDIDTDKIKELIRLFRPERNGELTCLDFVKSCDKVYKEMRLLRASIANSGQIDHAFEIMVNILFYLIVLVIILAALNLDPLALFVSISGIILAFAFMISSASSRFFEGILFILVRRPYDIGDRIAVSNPEQDVSTNGSATWFVQTVGLFTTTVRFAATNEVATIANSSLAASRIINAKRSPHANVYVYMKFSVSVPYSKVLIFRKAVESFVKERPREFIALNGFRATRVEPDQGFIEYIIALGHRSSWQDVGTILQSRADATSYCLELANKLNMRYVAPPLPVNLSMVQPNRQLMDQRLGEVSLSSENPPSPSPSATQVVPLSPGVESISALFNHE